ncbi:unnamed protein product [Paramecium sonneborni]|uniref:Uncharacterized protein n=1 Tax=Paramecium sonneborni TaxID=65129 RepID=A0A8S1KSY0_9CILI|nr:unnamed protein product [Paramecium sonneborni]
MSLERVRKSLQIIFGIESNQTTREPLIQERIQQEFVFDSKNNDQHQNKFLIVNQQRKRSNQYFYAIDRLKSFYQNNRVQSNELEQIPVISYLGDLTEKKVNLNMSHARWNQLDRFSDNDSANFSSSLGEKLVQKSSNLLASVSKQQFRPYYMQENNQESFNNQFQSIQQQHQNNIQQSQKQQTIFGGNRSKVHFMREEKEQKSKNNKPESNFKRLGGILEDDFLLPSFLKDKVQDKNVRGQEIPSNNKLLELQNFNFCSINKQNNINESISQMDFNKIHSQYQLNNQIENDYNIKKQFQDKKQNQIRFWDKEPINEKNPFRTSSDGISVFENKIKPPWQVSNQINNLQNEQDVNQISENISINDFDQIQEKQEKQSTTSIEQQVNISFGGCDIDIQEDQKLKNNDQIEYQHQKNSLIFDNFVNPKFDFENHTPQSKEKAINIQKQLDFSEQTPVFKQPEENKQGLKEHKKIKIQGESQIPKTPRNNNFLFQKGDNRNAIEQIQKNLSTDFNAQENESPKRSNNNQLQVIQ